MVGPAFGGPGDDVAGGHLGGIRVAPRAPDLTPPARRTSTRLRSARNRPGGRSQILGYRQAPAKIWSAASPPFAKIPIRAPQRVHLRPYNISSAKMEPITLARVKTSLNESLGRLTAIIR